MISLITWLEFNRFRKIGEEEPIITINLLDSNEAGYFTLCTHLDEKKDKIYSLLEESKSKFNIINKYYYEPLEYKVYLNPVNELEKSALLASILLI